MSGAGVGIGVGVCVGVNVGVGTEVGVGTGDGIAVGVNSVGEVGIPWVVQAIERARITRPRVLLPSCATKSVGRVSITLLCRASGALFERTNRSYLWGYAFVITF